MDTSTSSDSSITSSNLYNRVKSNGVTVISKPQKTLMGSAVDCKKSIFSHLGMQSLKHENASNSITKLNGKMSHALSNSFVGYKTSSTKDASLHNVLPSKQNLLQKTSKTVSFASMNSLKNVPERSLSLSNFGVSTPIKAEVLKSSTKRTLPISIGNTTNTKRACANSNSISRDCSEPMNGQSNNVCSKTALPPADKSYHSLSMQNTELGNKHDTDVEILSNEDLTSVLEEVSGWLDNTCNTPLSTNRSISNVFNDWESWLLEDIS